MLPLMRLPSTRCWAEIRVCRAALHSASINFRLHSALAQDISFKERRKTRAEDQGHRSWTTAKVCKSKQCRLASWTNPKFEALPLRLPIATTTSIVLNDRLWSKSMKCFEFQIRHACASVDTDSAFPDDLLVLQLLLISLTHLRSIHHVVCDSSNHRCDHDPLDSRLITCSTDGLVQRVRFWSHLIHIRRTRHQREASPRKHVACCHHAREFPIISSQYPQSTKHEHFNQCRIPSHWQEPWGQESARKVSTNSCRYASRPARRFCHWVWLFIRV